MWVGGKSGVATYVWIRPLARLTRGAELPLEKFRPY